MPAIVEARTLRSNPRPTPHAQPACSPGTTDAQTPSMTIDVVTRCAEAIDAGFPIVP